MKLKIGLFLFIAAVCSYNLLTTLQKGPSLVELEYIVTETKGPDSFDPINADKTQNISVMRMLFSTPLEIDRNNVLISSVLDRFEYDNDKKEIHFLVKENLKYEDGQSLTSGDVALSIARMAYFRPTFPVIKHIEGIESWVSSKNVLTTLPSGISVSGRSIRVKLSRSYANPLFRFCLELFSIIPSNCINKRTGELTCDQPPASGYFVITNKDEDKIIFSKRENGPASQELIPYTTIQFTYRSLTTACQEISKNSIVTGNELDYLSSKCGDNNDLKLNVHWLPSARFGVVRFNSTVQPFKNAKNRRIFSEEVRRAVHKKNPHIQIEKGIFSALLPGYISNEKFSPDFPSETKDFLGREITLPRVKQSGLKVIADAIIEAANSLGMKVSEINIASNEDLISAFLNGQIPAIAGASGFWAQDPIGDVSMWFTPNLHKTMTFVWSDKELYRQIGALENETDPNHIKSKMESLNYHIFENSIVAPVAHFRRLYITRDDISNLNLPQAVTSPAPWQLQPQK